MFLQQNQQRKHKNLGKHLLKNLAGTLVDFAVLFPFFRDGLRLLKGTLMVKKPTKL